MGTGPLVNYEIYLQQNRRWTLQVRFAKGERDAALEEAKIIERALNAPVKVIKETYFPESNTSEEVTVYLTAKVSTADAAFSPQEAAFLAKRQARAAAAPAPARRPPPRATGTAPAAAGRPTPARRPVGLSTGAIMLRLVGVTSASLAIAGAATLAVWAAAIRTGWLFLIAGHDSYPNVVFLIFAASFLLTAVPLSLRYMNVSLETLPAPRPQPPVAIRVGRDDTPPPPPPPPPEPEPEPEPAPEPELANREPVPPRPPEPEPAPEPVVERALPAFSMAVEAQRYHAMRFLSGMIEALKPVRPQLDAFNKFGVDLMLAGAMEVMGQRRDLSEDEWRELLRGLVELMGAKPAMAQSFCEKYEDYVIEPRYLHMVQAGRDAMRRFLDDDPQPHAQVAAALEVWDRPSAPQSSPRIITVIFTDMVGSTDLTQSRGDIAAQEVVRRHNAIVRNALGEYDGKEIKHTGDGIMASFTSTSNAVDACIAIQRVVAVHNLAAPDLPLHLRIGINAGEPIEEEDDLFGTTVQLAARVCAKAATDQILCTNVVRELCAGKSRDFVALGRCELKGFKDPFDLFEVRWVETSVPAHP